MFRIVTERKGLENVRAILARLGLDYSIFFGMGSYKLQPEECMVLEFEFADRANVLTAAQLIGEANAQECVLFQCIPSVSEMVCTKPLPEPERHTPAAAVAS
jgi:hypothetical protein